MVVAVNRVQQITTQAGSMGNRVERSCARMEQEERGNQAGPRIGALVGYRAAFRASRKSTRLGMNRSPQLQFSPTPRQRHRQ